MLLLTISLALCCSHLYSHLYPRPEVDFAASKRAESVQSWFCREQSSMVWDESAKSCVSLWWREISATHTHTHCVSTIKNISRACRRLRCSQSPELADCGVRQRRVSSGSKLHPAPVTVRTGRHVSRSLAVGRLCSWSSTYDELRPKRQPSSSVHEDASAIDRAWTADRPRWSWPVAG